MEKVVTVLTNISEDKFASDTLYFFPSLCERGFSEFLEEQKDELMRILCDRMSESAPTDLKIVSPDLLSDEQKQQLVSLYLPDRTEKEIASLLPTLDWSLLNVGLEDRLQRCSFVIKSSSKGTLWGFNLSASHFHDDLDSVLDAIIDCPNDLGACYDRSPKSRLSKSKPFFGEAFASVFSYTSRDIERCSERCVPEDYNERFEHLCNEMVELQRARGIDVTLDVFQKGILEMLKNIQPAILSRLVVTDEFQLFLPDYQNKEVKLGALEKTLYFLFLIRPEGICLVDLDRYEKDLRKIYAMLSNRENTDKMNESIRGLVEPGSTTCQQKLTRIRKAFKDCMIDDLALEYTPNGKRGEAYSIRLDRKLLTLPQSLMALR